MHIQHLDRLHSMYYVAKDGADAFETYHWVTGAGLLEDGLWDREYGREPMFICASQ